MVNFAESEGVNAQNTLQLHVVSFDKLSVHWSASLQSSVEMVANAVGTSPGHVAALVIAPNVGRPGNAFDVGKISECEVEVETLFKEDQYNFRVVRVFLPFAEESLQRKSTRPGGTTAWFCSSRTRNADGKFVSKWKGSYLPVRQRALTDCPVLPRTQWLNPCAPMARPLGYKLLMDLTVEEQAAATHHSWFRSRYETSAKDVMCCVKTYMRDTHLQQAPLCVLPGTHVNLIDAHSPPTCVGPTMTQAGNVHFNEVAATVGDPYYGYHRAAACLRSLVRSCEEPAVFTHHTPWLHNVADERGPLHYPAQNPFFTLDGRKSLLQQVVLQKQLIYHQSVFQNCSSWCRGACCKLQGFT